jgi:transcriptional antiterminator
MGVAKKGQKNTAYHPSSLKIKVLDLKLNTTTTYNSIREAARALNINKTSIQNSFYRNQQKPYKGRFIFTKL